MAGVLVLLRHGQTEWARDGRHTGLTDLPLTDVGVQQARAAAGLLSDVLGGAAPALVLTSPLQRAATTAGLAGLHAETEPRLLEWDYGGYEGLTGDQIRERAGADWTMFDDGVVPGATPGETLQQVADRGRAVIARVTPVLADGDVVLVGHGHALRVLATCWLGADPRLAERLLLDPAGVSVLAPYRDVPSIRHWNLQARG